MTTYSEAKAQNLKFYDPSKPCPRGHMIPRYTSNQSCPECNAIRQREVSAEKQRRYTKAYRERNPEKVKAYVEANRERDNQKALERYYRNREARLIKAKEWRDANREHTAEVRKEWVKNSRPLLSAKQARRRAAKIQATPSWADHDKIVAFYVEAERLTRETGIEHQVDHIFPLQGKLCCGLHVETNLQILTKDENVRKNNQMPAYTTQNGMLVIL